VVNNNRYVFTGNGREFEGMGRFFGSVIRTDQASRNFSGYGNWNRWFEKKKESLENLPKVLKDAIKVGDVKKVAQGGLQSLKRSTDDAQKVAKGRARELSNGIKNSAAFKKLESNVDLGNKVKQVTDNTSRNLKFLTRQGLPGSKKVKEGVHLVKERVVSQFEKVKPEEVIRTVKKQGEQVAHATKGSMKKLEVASKKEATALAKKIEREARAIRGRAGETVGSAANRASQSVEKGVEKIKSSSSHAVENLTAKTAGNLNKAHQAGSGLLYSFRHSFRKRVLSWDLGAYVRKFRNYMLALVSIVSFSYGVGKAAPLALGNYLGGGTRRKEND